MSGGVHSSDPVSLAVARAFRDERSIVLATLIRQAGDFQLAEDAVQDAFEAAVTAWRRDGIPANPGAWITTAARRRAIDRLRRDRSVTDRAERLAALMRLDAGHEEEPTMADAGSIVGERLSRLIPDDAEVWGLSSLMLLHDARRAARVDSSGRWVALDEQDRSLWDQGRIREGLARLERAVRLRRPGEYQLHAAITALQMQSAEAGGTGWAQIAELYGALARLNPSPVVELNRAVAVGLASGPAAGLALLEPLLGESTLERYQPLHAAHAELLSRSGDAAGAARAYERAIALSANAVERAELERRLRVLR